MPTVLTDSQRQQLKRIIKAGKAGRKTHKYYRAKALLAYDMGLPSEKVFALLGLGVLRKASTHEESAPPSKPGPTFEEDLEYVLDKNAELYRRLAQ